MRKLHALSGLYITVFACLHLTNHLVGLGGVDAHIGFMRAARSIYRSPLIEGLLLLAVAFQIFSGVRLFIRG